VKDLKGNWTHDKQKVSKKAKLIILQAYQSHKYQKTKHKKLIQHLHIHWGACLVTMNFLQSQGRGETGKIMDRALKDNGIAQHPK
jgi:hypothetical protein